MAQKPELELISSTDVEVRTVEWLWPFLIPRGKVTLLQEDSRDGKSKFMLTMPPI